MIFILNFRLKTNLLVIWQFFNSWRSWSFRYKWFISKFYQLIIIWYISRRFRSWFLTFLIFYTQKLHIFVIFACYNFICKSKWFLFGTKCLNFINFDCLLIFLNFELKIKIIGIITSIPIFRYNLSHSF